MTARPPRIGLVVVSSPLEVGAAEAPTLLETAQRALAATGGVEIVAGLSTTSDQALALGWRLADARVDLVCAIAASWFEDYLVVDLLEECDVPVVTWGRPGMETGALCGMQQLDMVLHYLDKPYLFLFDAPDSPAAARRVRQYAAAAALRRDLRTARIGMLGHPVTGMPDAVAHELALKRILGPRSVPIDMAQFLERMSRVDVAPLQARWDALAARVGRVSARREDGIASLQAYEAFQATQRELGLAAIAVGCYPHLMGRVCLAASLLAEEGFPLGCEGDLNGALGMLILARLSGQPVHNTDQLDPIPTDNAIVYTHCGAGGFSLAQGPEQVHLAPVRLMNQGVCCLFPARPGAVTLISLLPEVDGGYKLGLLHGEAVPTEMVFPGNPLRVRYAENYREILAWIAAEGLGHHWMAAYGDWRTELRDLCALTGCRLVMRDT